MVARAVSNEHPATVVLGVTGSIAAYKSANLASLLVKSGVRVHVIMTAAAQKLVAPRTFLTISRNPVVTDLWESPDWKPEHIALADLADLLVVAPATANMLAKMANGIADDALSTFALSHSGPVLVAPAMNPVMWRHPATQANVAVLKSRGVFVAGPEPGALACGTVGEGRMVEPDNLARTVRALLAARRIRNRRPLRILVTAGPTREYLDPVRFLTNRSSGRMGDALARVAAAAGHKVTLVSGPTPLPDPPCLETVRVTTAEDMADAVLQALPDFDVLIMAAAVADYTPARTLRRKMKKGPGDKTLRLRRTRDILAAAAAVRQPGQVIVGFAAETGDPVQAARCKMEEKRLDAIVANDVSRSGVGFESEENEVTVITRDAAVRIPRMDKIEAAARILDLVLPFTGGDTDSSRLEAG